MVLEIRTKMGTRMKTRNSQKKNERVIFSQSHLPVICFSPLPPPPYLLKQGKFGLMGWNGGRYWHSETVPGEEGEGEKRIIG